MIATRMALGALFVFGLALSASAQGPRGTWLGQDGQDRVGPSGRPEPNDAQDIHVRLDGLPRKEISLLTIKGVGGDEWNSKGQGSWLVLVERGKDPARADLYFEPSRVETGRGFEVVIDYADGSRTGFFINGGKADPNRRMAAASLEAKWLGTAQNDRVGEGPSVGPDGQPDAAIALEKLSPKIGIQWVRIEGTGEVVWQSGTNPQGALNAEVVRDPKDPSRAEVFLQPTKDLKGPLKVTVRYDGDREDSATLSAGKMTASNRATAARVPELLPNQARAKWLGQDGTDLVGRGDVHVLIENLPSARGIAGVVLSNASRTACVWKGGDQVNSLVLDPYPWPLEVKRGNDARSVHLLFPPDRDETGSTLLARIIFDDGKMTLVKVPGGKADIRARSPAIGTRTITAKPGDDLHRLVETSGTIKLTRGTYELDRPLVLPEPVALVGESGTILRFTQKDPAPWTAAIKVHRGNTRLEGFAVRFAGPVRWRPDVDFDPAVIGTTDNHDQVPNLNDPKAGIVLARLDLESSPPANPQGREEAVALARLVRSCGGRIEKCTLRGGLVRFTQGPWEVVENEYRGTHPGTFAWTVFSCFNSHDLLLKGNTARPVGPSGKTWRFLVQTVSGLDDVIAGNRVEAIGPRDDDTHHENAPEIILTEAYRVHFEGTIAGLSSDGRIVRVPRPQGDPARTGDIVAVLSGPDAGKWSRVAQAIDANTYVVDPPLSKNTKVVSIVTGFVRETYRDNTIDSRGGTVACNLVLVGSHFGLDVRNNVLKGGGGFKITAAPSESPLHWGWSHVPCFDATIMGNTLEDQGQPSLLAVEREGPVKSSRDRVYLTATLEDNVVAWTSARPKGTRGAEHDYGLKLNDDTTPLDPGEALVRERGNRARGGTAKVRVLGATVNGRVVRDESIALPDETTTTNAPR